MAFHDSNSYNMMSTINTLNDKVAKLTEENKTLQEQHDNMLTRYTKFEKFITATHNNLQKVKYYDPPRKRPRKSPPQKEPDMDLLAIFGTTYDDINTTISSDYESF